MLLRVELKQFLINSRPWYSLNLVRNLTDILRWVRAGCTGAAPHPIKMMIVGAYLRRFSIGQFVETGTYLGETLRYVANTGIRCTSIELSEELHRAACKRFAGLHNVTLIQGDSGQKISQLLTEINEPVLFWLDGHYSSGITAKAASQTPVNAELRAILGHPIKKHVVLIDDARCFDGRNDFPYLEHVLSAVREDGNYIAEVSADIIRIVPRTTSAAA